MVALMWNRKSSKTSPGGYAKDGVNARVHRHTLSLINWGTVRQRTLRNGLRSLYLNFLDGKEQNCRHVLV